MVVAHRFRWFGWFVLCVTFGSLFIVIGKRYAELLEVGEGAGTRATLDVYDITFSGFAGQPVRAWYRRPRGADGSRSCIAANAKRMSPRWPTSDTAPGRIALIRHDACASAVTVPTSPSHTFFQGIPRVA